MTVFAYLRVSKTDMTTENQKLEIKNNGFHVDEYFSEDGVSGTKSADSRPEFSKMLSKMERGDILVVTKVDRLGRNAADVLTTVNKLKDMGIGVKIIQFGGVDAASPAGKMMMTMLAAFAEMERDTLIERTKAGIERTKAQGTKLGAPLTIKPDLLKSMIARKNEGASLDKLVAEFGIPRNTIARNLRKWGGNVEGYVAEWNARESQYALKAA